MERVYIGVGSNLGNRMKNIKMALKEISKLKNTKLIKVAKIVKTEPMYYENQPYFLNTVCEIKTQLPPLKLFYELKKIEKKLGRKKTFRYGPRTIDLDILFYGNKILKNKKIKIPHEKLHERKFVLEPMYELNKNLLHPALKKTIKELLNRIS